MADLRPLSSWRRALSLLSGQLFGGARDLYEIFGWPREISAENYVQTYRRQDIAGRICDAFPDATWRESPLISSPTGELEEEIAALDEQFKLWGTMNRLDRLTGLGHYGVLLIGLSGGESLAKPTRGNGYKMIYLQPYSEGAAQINRWETDATSARYNKPQSYLLNTGINWQGVGSGSKSQTADWTRVIHIAEGALDDESIGIPRLERIYNRLNDLDKLLGGSAEVYWQNAAMLRAWKAESEVEWDPKEQADMEAQFEELQHGLRRDVRVRGVEPQSLAAAVADPGTQIDKQLDVIAGAIGIPKRILIGSERGELSSTQDETAWSSRIQERRKSFVTPNIIRPLITRLQNLGVITYQGEFDVEWPESDTLGEEKRATIALNKAQAVETYVRVPGADQVVPVQEFRLWLGEEEESEFAMNLDDVDNDVDESDSSVVRMFNRIKANAEAKTLYVRRNVVNANDLRSWAKSQGFKSRVPAGDMHVTIAFSRKPIDWLKVGQSWDDKIIVSAGGPRVVEALGDKGAVVLMFANSDLAWRHRDIIDAGASWDWPDYQPHVTITYDGEGIDLSKVEPYRGEIVFGPEIFEEVNENWTDTIKENAGK